MSKLVETFSIYGNITQLILRKYISVLNHGGLDTQRREWYDCPGPRRE